MVKQRKPVIGLMGPGNPADATILNHAEELGKKIAQKNWILLTGGRKAGVMHAASKGAAGTGGEVIGILPTDSHHGMSNYVSIPILTGMGSARNFINILTADVVIVCGMGLGTASEASLAIKYQKPLLFTRIGKHQFNFFKSLTSQSLFLSDETNVLIQHIEKVLYDAP